MTSATQQNSYAPPPFSLYQPILERMPFGAIPKNLGVENIDAAAAKDAALEQMEQEKLARQINMSAVNVTPQGKTAIGFTDLSQKPPVSYYLVVGTESGGWKVNNADYTEETAEIEKDGVTIQLQLGKGLVPQAADKPPPVPSIKRPTLTTIKQPVIRGRAPTPPPALTAQAADGSTPAASIRDQLRKVQSSGGDVRSYMERLRERKIQESTALRQADADKRKQLEKLARDVASKEIQKQTQAIAEEAALQKELAMEEEQLLKAEAEAEAEAKNVE